MKLSDKKGVQHIISFLASAGIKNVVLSPGSRNAPLSLSFAHHGGFNLRVIPDERVAAYHALGISIYTQEPTVICCTSGTAVLNYAPAIAEAYYQHVPLIVITADRPSEWVDQGDGQTIRQKNVFANYIGMQYNIDGDANDEQELQKINDQLNEAWNFAAIKKLPVHINVALQEPLYRLEESNVKSMTQPLPLPVDFFDFNLLTDLKGIYKSSKRILVLCGQMQANAGLNAKLEAWSVKKNGVVLTENTSNLSSVHFISCIDRTIDGFTEEDAVAYSPDLLITIGDSVVSKKVKAWLRKYKPAQHWKIGRQDTEMDTYRAKTYSLSVEPEYFFEQVISWESSSSDYQERWLDLHEKKKMAQSVFLRDVPYSDLSVFSYLSDAIPSGTFLHLGNSSPVRYTQLFDKRPDLFYYSNRGVSGIDGCTSTAAGMADVSGKQVTLISGDISFFYDSNAFWNDYLKNLKVIVINNGGGGIFRIIDQPENIKDTELLFETRHNRKAKGIAAAFGIQYLDCHDESSLEKAVKQLYANNLPGVLEIFTPTEKNPLILKQYFTHLKNI